MQQYGAHHLCREKELAKALLQQERAVGRKGRGVAEGGPIHHHHGPPDDLDLEMEALLVRARATAAAQAAARGLDPSAVDPVVPPRPEFPPPYLMMQVRPCVADAGILQLLTRQNCSGSAKRCMLRVLA